MFISQKLCGFFLNKSFSASAKAIKSLSTYNALHLEKYGENLVIKELTQPQLNKEQVRIAVHSCGVNSSDLLMLEGKYDKKVNLPFVPGFEICGEIVEIAEGVTTFSKGQRVVGLNKEALGGFAEECVLHEDDVWPLDMSVSFECGASLPENYATALLGLNRRASIGPSSCVMVTAAAGGLGLAAVDLAANVYKSKVIGVCGTEDKADLVRQNGAWAALKYNPKHMRNKVNEVTEGAGADVVFDAVGGEVFENSLQCVGFEGHVLVAGFASRIIPHIDTSLLLPNTISLVGISLSHYRRANKPVYRQAVADVIDMHESGLISPHVSASFSLQEFLKAFEFIRERKSTGKVVLKIR